MIIERVYFVEWIMVWQTSCNERIIVIDVEKAQYVTKSLSGQTKYCKSSGNCYVYAPIVNN